MSTNVVQRIAMKGVLVRDGKVLLVRESPYLEGTNTGRYGIPGGRIEPGERWRDGLLREIREEVGLTDIVVHNPVAVREWFPTIRGVPHHIVAIFHLCTVPTGDVALGDEHDAFLWVGKDDWKSIDIMSPDDEVLTTYFASQMR